MMPKELLDDDMSEAIDGMRTRQEAFALATIIRTAGATAAKPGAKAVLDAQGQIVFGWIVTPILSCFVCFMGLFFLQNVFGLTVL